METTADGEEVVPVTEVEVDVVASLDDGAVGVLLVVRTDIDAEQLTEDALVLLELTFGNLSGEEAILDLEDDSVGGVTIHLVVTHVL